MPQIELSGLTGDIHASVNTLLHTPVGTVVNDRQYGLDFGALDCPPEVAETLLLADIEEKLERYEPRARVTDSSFTAAADGSITMKVVIAYAAQ